MLPSSDVATYAVITEMAQRYAAVVGLTATYAVTGQTAQVCCHRRTYIYLRSD
jgi:hypothetical protein